MEMENRHADRLSSAFHALSDPTRRAILARLDSSDPTQTTGRTRQHKLVHFATGQPLPSGSYAQVQIVRAAPHHLVGRFIEQTAAPRHKRRIAVLAG